MKDAHERTYQDEQYSHVLLSPKMRNKKINLLAHGATWALLLQ